ncbi:hypothetical protein MMX123_02720 [Microbacterium sp. MM2322]|uniref:hypothetical protein n=1 Tax=unclassified Microbacterium TaxID=2609290 RepID=UPI00177CD525|nr:MULTISPECIES: hypothetical protein [unclassified Microbacterium]MBD8207798.1 hypothetical protein [Microbacterium sp. CFBP 8801]MBD8510366.1 hypothetical protein [Microbacterium sp. CFBP 8790]
MTDITHTPHGAVELDDIVLSRFASYVARIATEKDLSHESAPRFTKPELADAFAVYVLAVPGTEKRRDLNDAFEDDHLGSYDTWGDAANSFYEHGFLNVLLTERDLLEVQDVFTLDLTDWAEQTVRRSVEEQCHVIRTTSGRVHLFRRRL